MTGIVTPSQEFCKGGFLNSSKEWMKGLQTFQTEVILPVNFFFWKNSMSVTSMMTQFIYLGLELESNRTIPNFDVLAIRKETILATKVYRKRKCAGKYLNFDSNHPLHVKIGLIRVFAKEFPPCQECEDLCKETSNLRNDLQLNGYPQSFIDSVN